jgi:hypothetical protein
MREVTVGEKTITIVASPITLYIYSREFGPKADLIGDLLSFQTVADGHPEDARFLSLLKVFWAMAKTAKVGAEFPSFEAWLGTVEIDLSDQVLWEGVLAEATRGFFRGAAAAQAIQEKS